MLGKADVFCVVDRPYRCLHRYLDSAERLQTESGVSLSRVDVADNIDLMYIVSVCLNTEIYEFR